MLGIGDHFYTAEMINKDAGNDSRIREMSLEEKEEGEVGEKKKDILRHALHSIKSLLSRMQ